MDGISIDSVVSPISHFRYESLVGVHSNWAVQNSTVKRLNGFFFSNVPFLFQGAIKGMQGAYEPGSFV